MPQTYRTRHLTAGENRLLDALENTPRGRALAAKFRPPASDDAPPKRKPSRPRKDRPESDTPDVDAELD